MQFKNRKNDGYGNRNQERLPWGGGGGVLAWEVTRKASQMLDTLPDLGLSIC